MFGTLKGEQGQRRSLLKAAGSAGTAAATCLASPALAKNRQEIPMVTAWINHFPGLGSSAARLISPP